jgi:hypothetical protein
VLGVEGDRFTIDGRPKFLFFVSYFDGLRRANAGTGTGDVDTDFAYLKRIGVDGIRLLPNWQYDCGRGPVDDDQKLFRPDGAINESMWPVLIRLIERAAVHRLIVDVTFTRETYDSPIRVDAYRAGIAAVTERLRPYRHLIFDVQNEYPIHELASSDVRDILAAVRSADPERLVTASGGASAIVHDPLMHVVAFHDSRDDSWHDEAVIERQLHDVRAAIAPATKPVYFQEPRPFRIFAPGCGHGEWPRVGYARQAAGRAARHGAAAWTFHTRQSFDLSRRSLKAILDQDPEQKAELEAATAVAAKVSGG